MNQKTLQVLSILTNSPQQYTKYEDLAKSLGVGTRSIRNYIQVISDYLKFKEPGRRLLSISEKGIAFMGSAQEGRRIYLTLTDFSERFNTSRGTVLKDMEQVKKLLEHHNLSFGPLINKGYLLVILESQRRDMIEKIIVSNSLSGLRHPSNFFYQFLVEESGCEEQKLADMIINLEIRHDINVSDACFDELLLFIMKAALILSTVLMWLWPMQARRTGWKRLGFRFCGWIPRCRLTG